MLRHLLKTEKSHVTDVLEDQLCITSDWYCVDVNWQETWYWFTRSRPTAGGRVSWMEELVFSRPPTSKSCDTTVVILLNDFTWLIYYLRAHINSWPRIDKMFLLLFFVPYHFAYNFTSFIYFRNCVHMYCGFCLIGLHFSGVAASWLGRSFKA